MNAGMDVHTFFFLNIDSRLLSQSLQHHVQAKVEHARSPPLPPPSNARLQGLEVPHLALLWSRFFPLGAGSRDPDRGTYS